MTAASIDKWLVHTDPYGNLAVSALDKTGKLIPPLGQLRRFLEEQNDSICHG